MKTQRVALAALLVGCAGRVGTGPIEEVALANYVEDRISADGRLDDAKIRATDDDGVVVLAGTVKSADDVALAGRIAAATPGVEAVLNELRVNDPREAPENAAVYDEGIVEPHSF